MSDDFHPVCVRCGGTKRDSGSTADVAAPFEQPDDGLGLPDDMAEYRAYVLPAEIVNRYPVEVASGSHRP